MGDTGFQFKEGRGKVAAVPEPPKKEWPPELLAEAADYIDQEFIDDGGDYREDSKGRIFWLDLDHLVEFEKADKVMDDDREFWEWFRDYREANKIAAKSKPTRTSWKSWDHDYAERSHNYMTSWWGGWGYNPNSELNQRLAIALGAVQSIVDVINDTGKRTKTRLSSQDQPDAPMSYTDLNNFEVVVSPVALLDTSIPQEDGIEVTAGWGLHEGSHVQYSTSVMEAMTKPSVLRPLALTGFLFNILEDVRIEARTGTKYPGFTGYFAKANNYLWDITKKHAPKVWGPELGDKINAITSTVKWGTEFGEIVAHSKDQQLKDEYIWFTNWAAAYKDDTKPIRIALIEALRHLAEDDKTKQQMADLTQKEMDQDRSASNPGHLTDGQFKDLLKGLGELLKDKSKDRKLIEPCPSPGHGSGPSVKLTQDQAQQIDKLLREELKLEGLEVPGASEKTKPGDPKVTVLRPEETPASRSLYSRPGPIVNKMKSAFFFRKTAPEWADRDQRSGYLNENDVWKILGNDLKVFERKVTADIPNTQVTLLIDMSSSMRGHRITQAQEMANVMLECLRTMKGVTVRVRGHHTTAGTNFATVYRLWEPGDPMSRLGLAKAMCAGSTPDGYALDYCSKEMLEAHKPGEDMVLIILSDGEPNIAYDGLTGAQHVHKVVEHFHRRGVNTIQIAISSGMNHNAQRSMYRNWIPFENDQKLTSQLTRLLIKLFGGTT